MPEPESDDEGRTDAEVTDAVDDEDIFDDQASSASKRTKPAAVKPKSKTTPKPKSTPKPKAKAAAPKKKAAAKPGKANVPAVPKKRKTKEQMIHEKLKKMGIKRPAQASKCVKRAIYKGFIQITGDPAELEMVVHSEKGECGHVIEARLKDMLEQPDYAGCDYEDGLQEATVFCTHKMGGDEPNPPDLHEDPNDDSRCSSQEGRTYVTRICSGNPSFDSGKFHNHCGKCEHFGVCIGDYREAHCGRCKKHYFKGSMGYKCGCGSRRGFGGRRSNKGDCVIA